MENAYKELQLTEEQRAELYSTLHLKKDFVPLNHYVIVKDEEGNLEAILVQKDNGLQWVRSYEIPDSAYMAGAKARNDYQKMAIHMLLDSDSKVKIITGCYGSGKTHLGITAAMHLINRGYFEKLVWVRNTVEVRGVPKLGALPGGLEEKIAGWTAVLDDKLGGDLAVSGYERSGILQVEHLGFIRGRDFSNSIVYMTEGQNITGDIAKLLLGRIGEGSILIIDGDFKQTDNKMFDNDNGLNLLTQALVGNRLFAHVHLPISERSEVAALANVVDEWQEQHKK